MAIADGFAYRRAQMVEALRRAGVRDDRVLDAMTEVPRHLFVPETLRHQAYTEDVSIGIGEGQTISQPRVVAVMTEAARIGPDDKVLEVGTGSGYQAAVLARMARFVFTVERIPSLAREAKRRLDVLGVENVSVKVMDGTLGWRAQAPYSAILVTAGAPTVPEPLLEQLAEGGRMVIPVVSERDEVLTALHRRGAELESSEIAPCRFVPLIGAEGF